MPASDEILRATADEFERLPKEFGVELLDGIVSPRYGDAVTGAISARLSAALWPAAEARGVGLVIGSGGPFRCFPGRPDHVRRPNVAFVRWARLPGRVVPRGACPVPPDLVAVVRTGHPSESNARAAVNDFLAAGTPLVWVACDETHTVTAFSADGTTRRFAPADELDADPVLPGLRVRVDELFPNPIGAE